MRWIGKKRIKPCDPEIYNKGELIATLYDSHNRAQPDIVEKWVAEVATQARARLGWHYEGGVPQVLHLGDAESHQRVTLALRLNSRQSGIWVKDIFPRGAGTPRQTRR